MISELETYNELLWQGLQSWKETTIKLNGLDIDWNSPHPSLGVTLDVFDKGLTTGVIKSEVNISSSYFCQIIPVVIPKIICPIKL